MIRVGYLAVVGLPLALAGCGDNPAAFGITGPGTTITAPVQSAATGGGSAAGSSGMTDESPRPDGAPDGRYWQYNTR